MADDSITITLVNDERSCNHCLCTNFNDGKHKQVKDLFTIKVGKGGYRTEIVLCISCLLELRRAAGNAILPGSC